MNLTPSPKKPRVIRVQAYHIVMAMKEVWELKQTSRTVYFKSIGEKWGVPKQTLIKYWMLYMRGQLDIGIPLVAADRAVEEKMLQESQLELLRRVQEILIKACDQSISKLSTGQNSDRVNIHKLLKRQGTLELLTHLQRVNAMIMSVNGKYLKALDEHAEAELTREAQVSGIEVHAVATKMSDEAQVLRALDDWHKEKEAGLEIREAQDGSKAAEPQTG